MVVKHDPKTGVWATRPGRVFTSFGNFDAKWAIGTTHRVIHDQTRRFRGNFRVVGIARWSDTDVTIEGDVPDRPLGHSVFK